MKGRIASEITFTADRKQRVTIELDEDFRPAWDGLHGEDVEITVKKYRKKRRARKAAQQPPQDGEQKPQ